MRATNSLWTVEAQNITRKELKQESNTLFIIRQSDENNKSIDWKQKKSYNVLNVCRKSMLSRIMFRMFIAHRSTNINTNMKYVNEIRRHNKTYGWKLYYKNNGSPGKNINKENKMIFVGTFIVIKKKKNRNSPL